jgi:hypothetical protein
MSPIIKRLTLGLLLVALPAAAGWWYLDTSRIPDEAAATVAAARTVEHMATDPGAVAADKTDLGSDGYFDDVPSGSRIDVVDNSWAKTSYNTGSITFWVTGPGTEPVAYLADLRYRWGNWKVLDVIQEATDSPPPTPGT